MTKDKLKPCPFCGGEAEIIIGRMPHRLVSVGCKKGQKSKKRGKLWDVIQEECIGHNTRHHGFMWEEQAISAWNRRMG